MNYIGIDVGEKKYFAVWYSDRNSNIEKLLFKNFSDLAELIKNKNAIIAIDAPSCCCNIEHDRRRCEEELGIGGFFKTPKKKKLAKPWMQSGFKLWDFLSKRGYGVLERLPAKKGDLIEVHPTLIFKKIMNPEVNPKLWITRRIPISKSKSQGREHRREILKKRLSGHKREIDNFKKIDYLDALIAAYTTQQLYKGRGKGFGDSAGKIWFPI